MSRERGKMDWETMVATVLAVLGTTVAYAGLFAAVSRPVLDTLQRL